jgi:small GTP-binding protein
MSANESNSQSDSLFEEDGNHCESVSIILLGASGAGKSAIARRFATGIFDEVARPTIGLDYQQKQIRTTDGTAVNVTLYDTAGQERFANVTRSYYSKSDAAVIVFALDDEESYRRAAAFRKTMYDEKPGAPCILVGNKSDIAATPDYSALQKAAVETFQCVAGFVAVSAKTDRNCGDEITRKLAECVCQFRKNLPQTLTTTTKNTVVPLSAAAPAKKKMTFKC